MDIMAFILGLMASWNSLTAQGWHYDYHNNVMVPPDKPVPALVVDRTDYRGRVKLAGY